MRLSKLLLAALALFFWPAAAEARIMALLVGVADYNEASGIHDLLGPRNDVTMIWRALEARGAKPEDIAVLADGLPRAPEFPVALGPPEKANILAGLDRLAAEAPPPTCKNRPKE